MDIKAQFDHDVGAHTMEIVRRDGVHRHLRFRRSGSYVNGFDVITWPGTLCIHGDCGTYVFSRLTDMFEFFRSSSDRINPGYWAEKIEAQDKTGGVYEFCQDTFRQVVVEHFRDYWRGSGDFKGQLEAFRDLRDDVLRAEDESDAYRALYDFDSNSMSFTDCHEMRFRRYTGRYLWNCHAIAWAIQQFDASTYVAEVA